MRIWASAPAYKSAKACPTANPRASHAWIYLISSKPPPFHRVRRCSRRPAALKWVEIGVMPMNKVQFQSGLSLSEFLARLSYPHSKFGHSNGVPRGLLSSGLANSHLCITAGFVYRFLTLMRSPTPSGLFTMLAHHWLKSGRNNGPFANIALAARSYASRNYRRRI